MIFAYLVCTGLRLEISTSINKYLKQVSMQLVVLMIAAFVAPLAQGFLVGKGDTGTFILVC